VACELRASEAVKAIVPVAQSLSVACDSVAPILCAFAWMSSPSQRLQHSLSLTIAAAGFYVASTLVALDDRRTSQRGRLSLIVAFDASKPAATAVKIVVVSTTMRSLSRLLSRSHALLF